MSCPDARTSYLANKLHRFSTRALLAVPMAIAASGHAQIAPPLSFEVATVKPIDAKNPDPPSVMVSGDRFAASGMTLQDGAWAGSENRRQRWQSLVSTEPSWRVRPKNGKLQAAGSAAC